VDPLRRSGWRMWWRGEPSSLPTAIVAAAVLDVAKLLGVFAGLVRLLQK
jgi:hypothetical protein